MSRDVIFVDVDDTLVRSIGQSRIPMPNVIEAVACLACPRGGALLLEYGGAEYARSSAGNLGSAIALMTTCPSPRCMSMIRRLPIGACVGTFYQRMRRRPPSAANRLTTLAKPM